MTTTPTVHDIARRQVVRAARHTHVLYTKPAIVAVTALLEAWLAARLAARLRPSTVRSWSAGSPVLLWKP
jgi:hypothetical protein